MMQQQRFDNFYQHFYKNSRGERRKHGIFAPGVDRFILIDSYDFWVTLQTAEVLSSKVPTLAYILPPLNFNLNNDNCINYTIFNKTQQRVGPSPAVVGRQHPQLKFLYDQDTITEAGTPEDYKTEEGQALLAKLQKYAQFVHQRMFAISITEAFYNPFNTDRFVSSYLTDNWTSGFSARHDRSSLDKGVFFELRNILYLSDNEAEAEEKIINLWQASSRDQLYLILGYYKVLNTPVPDALKPMLKLAPENLSTFLF